MKKIFKELIQKINNNSNIKIKNEDYIVKTKTWYSIEEDDNVKYIKCELSNNKVLVIIPDDELIYIGKIVNNMNYRKISDTEIIFNNIIFHKTGEGHQYIINVDFGKLEDVEGKCIFEDYESDNYIISLGILSEKTNIRANVLADILSIEDIKI